VSLRARMGIAAGVAVALAVVAVAVSSYLGTRSELLSQIDESLQSISQSVLGPLNGPGPGGSGGANPALGALFNGYGAVGPFDHDEDDAGPGRGNEGLPLGLASRGQPAFGGAAGTVTLIYSDGKAYVPQGQRNEIPVTSWMKAIAARGRGVETADLQVGPNHIRVRVTGIGGRYGALAVALPLKSVDSTLSHELLLMLIIAAGGIALAALLAVLVARTAVAPISRFTRQTERIAANPDRVERERLEVTGDDELARLARTFNATLDALERSIVSQRNLVADASHELRTPIATIRANLQLMRDEELLPAEDREALRIDVIDELDELTRLVGDVVELARGSKAGGEPGDVRLDQIVGEAVERARRRGPELSFEAEVEPTLVYGEGERIARAVTNLLDNAIKWGPAGSSVEVTLHGGVLSVRDHGPGFHADDLPFVFDRFHRAADARSKPGSGLGLAIVRQAAEAHNGFAEAANAPDGGALMRVGFGAPLELPAEMVEA
jgi:two-component system, OmpR family, sensor histidine kinase MprB